MASANETPRQKMMGILYLVLLGLAATTVTDHVLDAFRNLTVSLEQSTQNVQNTVNNTFASFEAKDLKSDPARAQPIYNRAKKVRELSTDLNKYIESIKDDMVKDGGGRDEASGDVKNRADVDLSPRMMIKGKHRAADLKNKIMDTRAKILEQIDAKDRTGLKLALNADDPPRRPGSVKNTWEEDNFGEGIPLTAALTALTKIQADLKNTENEVVRKILGEATQVDIVSDKFKAVVVPKSTYVLDGQQYEARVFLAAYSSTQNPDISVGGQSLKVANGEGLYVANASGIGERKWKGVIRVRKADNTVSTFETDEQSYTVAPPSSNVTATKMAVFYIGVDNPVSVAAAGFSNDKVHPSISAGTISPEGGAGNFVVRVSAPGEVTVNVSGTTVDGKSVSLGATKFRAKRLPTPRATFTGSRGGAVPAVQLKTGNKLFALPDADFDFQAKFTITHFAIAIRKPRSIDDFVREVNGESLTPEMLSELSKTVAGTTIKFDYIQAKGPDGQTRQLDPITFTAR